MADTPKRPLRGEGSGTEQEPKDGKRRKQGNREKRSAWHWVWFGVKTLLIVIGGGIVLGIGAGTGYAAALLKGLPSITASTFSNISAPSIVYDRNGNVIGTFDKYGNRSPLKNLNQVSPNLVNAFVAAEDRTFWTNIGVNPVAMGRAFIQDVTSHHIESGASTITQQTVKLAVFPEQQQTLRRKVQEIALALKVNKMLTKQEIMTDYMNWVYYGNLGTHPVYGVQTAAQVIFHKNVKDLNLAEATLLAAIPNNASYYSPYVYSTDSGWSVDLTHVLQRQHYILNQMLQHGIINQVQYTTAMNFNISKDVHLPSTSANQKYQYLMQDEIPYLVAVDLGFISPQENVATNASYPQELAQAVSRAEDVLATGGYQIHTTIDKSMQDQVDKVLAEPQWYKGTLKPNFPVKVGNKTVSRMNQYQTGATIIDNKTGGILAIGGGDPNQGTYNKKPVTSSIDYSDVPRQPGSSIKPILEYGPAIDTHILTAASPLNDALTQFSANWAPHDDEPGWRGIVSVRTALVQSYNVPAIEVLQKLGVSTGESFLAKMGIDNNSRTVQGDRTWLTVPDKSVNPNASADDSNLTSAIGGLTNGLTTQQMASAYTVFSNQGVYKPSYMISSIVDSAGNTVYKHQESATQVFSPQATYVMDSILRDVVLHGTAADIGSHFGNIPIYGKTGTSDSEDDGWFIGFTQDYTTALWTGYQYATKIYAPAHAGNLYNQKFAIWNSLMDPIIKKENPKPIPNPGGVVSETVCKYSGQLPTPLCSALGGTYSELFVQGTQPTQPDTMHVQLEYTVINGTKYLATTNTPPAEIQVGVFLKPPFKVNPSVKTDTSQYYAPTKPDPRGGTILAPLSGTQLVKPPAAPQNVTAAVTGSAVQLSWTSVAAADSYTVYRATTANGPFTEITSSPITGTSFIDTAVPSGISTVYYEVDAIANQLQSVPSSAVQVNINAGGPGNPGGSPPDNSTPPASPSH